MIFILFISEIQVKALVLKLEGALKMETINILENLSDMGCDERQTSSMKKLYEEGDKETLLRNLRQCRCHLMDELHDSQKKVDNMDYLIRQIQKEK